MLTKVTVTEGMAKTETLTVTENTKTEKSTTTEKITTVDEVSTTHTSPTLSGNIVVFDRLYLFQKVESNNNKYTT